MPKTLAALAVSTLIGLSACGSAPSSSMQAGVNPAPSAHASGETMAFTSLRPAAEIATCLAYRVHAVLRAAGGRSMQLALGNDAWLVTLTQTRAGTAVGIKRSPGSDGPISEPEMRFHIARCVV